MVFVWACMILDEKAYIYSFFIILTACLKLVRPMIWFIAISLLMESSAQLHNNKQDTLNPFKEADNSSISLSLIMFMIWLMVSVPRGLIDVQRSSFDKIWGHCIDGRNIVQESSTVLTINPNLGYVFWSTPTTEGVWIQEGIFCNVFMFNESHPGMLTEQQLASEGPSLPSLLSPHQCLNLLSMQICSCLLDNPTQYGQNPCTINNFCFSVGKVCLPWQSKWYTP